MTMREVNSRMKELLEQMNALKKSRKNIKREQPNTQEENEKLRQIKWAMFDIRTAFEALAGNMSEEDMDEWQEPCDYEANGPDTPEACFYRYRYGDSEVWVDILFKREFGQTRKAGYCVAGKMYESRDEMLVAVTGVFAAREVMK